MVTVALSPLLILSLQIPRAHCLEDRQIDPGGVRPPPANGLSKNFLRIKNHTRSRFKSSSAKGVVMSALPAISERRALFDHLVSAGKERLGDRHTERLCGFQVDDQIGFG
jgi:hypothetical protein